jgi:hypothetical protein
VTLEDIRSAIMATLSSNLATASLPICYPNQSFTAPQAAWIRPTIKMGDTLIGELGEDGIGMRVGILMISVFGLAGEGTKTILGYASRLEAIFRRKEISGIVFNEPSTDMAGLDEAGYFQVIVSCDFTTWVGETP